MDLTPEQFARLSRWFDEALDLQADQRKAFVGKVRTEEDDRMADELQKLLDAHDRSTDTMDQPLLRLPQLEERDELPAFQKDEVILNRFRIVRVLGRGGMGEVYEAHDQELGPIALKTIRRDLLGDRAILRRFKHEVQMARRVTSPYVCRIHELFIPAGNAREQVRAFLTMELLDGITLAKRIQEGPLEWSEAQPIAIELCLGLDALHSMGLVHRDFKPGNAMLARRGKVKHAVVMDFGLAMRPEESLTGGSKLTVTNGIVGTPGYMAPEQFAGETVSAATDIYALGLVLYEMTTGKQAFEASKPLAAVVSRAKPPRPVSSVKPGLPRRLDQVVGKCLALDPADRFQSAEELGNALKECRPIGLGFSIGTRAPSRRTVLSLTAGTMVAGAVATKVWPEWETWRHPLPARRLVAAMMWPKLTNPQHISLLSQLLTSISRELARAEAYDRQFLILDGSTSAKDYAASTPAEAAGILGANLILAASVLAVSSGLEVALSVLDPASPVPLRQDKVRGSSTTLPRRAAQTAARLLNVRLDLEETKAVDEFANVPAAAYQLFINAENQMRSPNDEGLGSAIEEYQAAVNTDSRFAAAYAGLSIAYGRRFAFRHDQSDLLLSARNSTLALKYEPASSRAQFSQSLVKLYSGGTEEALRILYELLNRDPGNEELLMYEARALQEVNKIDLEEQVYQNLLTRRPNYWPAYNDLGLIYRRKGDYQGAVKHFLLATAIAPRAALPWTNLGAAYFLLGRTDDARQACVRAIGNHPNEGRAHNFR